MTGCTVDDPHMERVVDRDAAYVMQVVGGAFI